MGSYPILFITTLLKNYKANRESSQKILSADLSRASSVSEVVRIIILPASSQQPVSKPTIQQASQQPASRQTVETSDLEIYGNP